MVTNKYISRQKQYGLGRVFVIVVIATICLLFVYSYINMDSDSNLKTDPAQYVIETREPVREAVVLPIIPGSETQFPTLHRNVDKGYLVIATVFAGRKRNLEVQLKYIDELIRMNIIDYYHIWDFTRNVEDREYLQSIRSKYTVVKVDSWRDYYVYYSGLSIGDKDVIIKMDDDIVFVDVEHFGNFVKTVVANPHHLAVVPSIVNNNVAAYYQYKNKVHPIPFPYDHTNGRLWSSGPLAETFHEYFLENHRDFIDKSRKLGVETHTIGDRFSINMIAFLGKNIHVLRDVHGDDEHMITVEFPRRYNMSILIDLSTVISHLAYFKQRETGIDEWKLQDLYMQLYSKVYDPPTSERTERA